jgi:UDP-glucuronate 4-epimerase
MPMQDGDVPAKFADVSAIRHDFEFHPTMTVANGVPRVVQWYEDYHGIA